jgi:hypothetical protein
VDCIKDGHDFLIPTNRVRDTLEQIDVARLMMDRYSDTFEFCETAQDVRDAIKHGKIASLIGIEGYVAMARYSSYDKADDHSRQRRAHQLGNSLAGEILQMTTHTSFAHIRCFFPFFLITRAQSFANSTPLESVTRPSLINATTLSQIVLPFSRQLNLLMEVSRECDSEERKGADGPAGNVVADVCGSQTAGEGSDL